MPTAQEVGGTHPINEAVGVSGCRVPSRPEGRGGSESPEGSDVQKEEESVSVGVPLTKLGAPDCTLRQVHDMDVVTPPEVVTTAETQTKLHEV